VRVKSWRYNNETPRHSFCVDHSIKELLEDDEITEDEFQFDFCDFSIDSGESLVTLGIRAIEEERSEFIAQFSAEGFRDAFLERTDFKGSFIDFSKHRVKAYRCDGWLRDLLLFWKLPCDKGALSAALRTPYDKWILSEENIHLATVSSTGYLCGETAKGTGVEFVALSDNGIELPIDRDNFEVEYLDNDEIISYKFEVYDADDTCRPWHLSVISNDVGVLSKMMLLDDRDRWNNAGKVSANNLMLDLGKALGEFQALW
jgi:hypothetical protein